MLLSDAYDRFSNFITECSQNTNSATMSKRVFHKHLISSLHEHLECKTVEQSVGIILYCKNGKVMKSLSKSLSHQRHARLTQSTGTCMVDTSETTSATTYTNNEMLLTVSDTINDRVHNAIDKVLQQDKQQPLDLSSINIQEDITKTNEMV